MEYNASRVMQYCSMLKRSTVYMTVDTSNIYNSTGIKHYQIHSNEIEKAHLADIWFKPNRSDRSITAEVEIFDQPGEVYLEKVYTLLPGWEFANICTDVQLHKFIDEIVESTLVEICGRYIQFFNETYGTNLDSKPNLSGVKDLMKIQMDDPLGIYSVNSSNGQKLNEIVKMARTNIAYYGTRMAIFYNQCETSELGEIDCNPQAKDGTTSLFKILSRPLSKVDDHDVNVHVHFNTKIASGDPVKITVQFETAYLFGQKILAGIATADSGYLICDPSLCTLGQGSSEEDKDDPIATAMVETIYTVCKYIHNITSEKVTVDVDYYTIEVDAEKEAKGGYNYV